MLATTVIDVSISSTRANLIGLAYLFAIILFIVGLKRLTHPNTARQGNQIAAIGMFIAAYFLITGVFGLQLLGLTGWVTEVFYGVALIVAVTVSHLLQRRVKG